MSNSTRSSTIIFTVHIRVSNLKPFVKVKTTFFIRLESEASGCILFIDRQYLFSFHS